MNAGRILRKAGLDTPELRAELAPVDPDTIKVMPASRWLRKLWKNGVTGVTQGRWVFVDPKMFEAPPERLARLVIHELVHVKQFAERGYVRFMSRYGYENLRGRLSGKSARQAYLDIWAESEAREIAARFTR